MPIKSKVIREDIENISSSLREYYNRLSGKTVLIAGGAGFLGRYMVLTLNHLNETGKLEEPCKIIIMDNFVTGLPEWIPEDENIKLIEHDISKPVNIEGKIDYIINAASIASPVFYHRLRLETIDAGILGTKNLLELAKEKNVESFLFISSSEIYGNPDPNFIPTNEEYLGNVSCTGPRACYDEPKRMGETLCVNYGDIYNIPVKIARPFNIFGPGIRLDDGRVVPAFVLSAIQGKRIPVHGDGKKTRTFCYISNATTGFFQVLLSSKNREAFNIGADNPEIEIRHFAEIVHGLVENEESKINLVEGTTDVYTKSNPDRRCPDLTKIRSVLGYNPKVNMIKGLKRFIEWVREELENDREFAYMESKCRVCGNEDLREFLSLGRSPLANNLINSNEIEKDEESYPLVLNYCPECYNCQLSHTVEPKKMFDDYKYVTSTTKTFRDHFSSYAEKIASLFGLSSKSLVIDVGSNDGLLLKGFNDLGVRTVGIEPASRIAEIAREEGVDTISDYLNERTVEDILKIKGKADIVTANNVFAHVGNIKEFTRNVKKLLKDDGAFVIEVQYIMDTVKNLTFDNIYHEHVSYFSLLSLSEFFKRQNMEIFRVERNNSHGGTIRVFVQKDGGPHKLEESVPILLQEEREFGLDKFETYKNFADKVYEIRNKIVNYISEIKLKNGKIVGYGAPAKATTLLNFCGINKENIDFVIDDNPLKQELIIPGVKIPIKGRDKLNEFNPDYVLILAWNFAEEIMRNNQSFKDNGTKFIVPLPEPKIV